MCDVSVIAILYVTIYCITDHQHSPNDKAQDPFTVYLHDQKLITWDNLVSNICFLTSHGSLACADGKKKTCSNLSIRVPNIYGLHPEPHLQISFAFLKRWTHTCARYLQRTFLVSETSIACYLHSQWSFKWKTTTAAWHSLFWLINSILHEEKGALCKSDYSPNCFFLKVHWLSEYRSKIYFTNLF